MAFIEDEEIENRLEAIEYSLNLLWREISDIKDKLNDVR